MEEPPPEHPPLLIQARSSTPELAARHRSVNSSALGSDGTLLTTSSAIADEVHHLYLLKSSSTIILESFFTNVRSYAGRVVSLGQWFGTLMLFLVANCALPLICGFQLGCLDYVFWRQGVSSLPFHFAWALVLFEVCLWLHLIRYRETYAVGNGGIQWIVYSWLISAKSCVLYFKVLPELSSTGANSETIGSTTTKWLFDDARGIVTILWLTPVFYAVLTFRTLRELFQTDKTRRVEVGGRPRPRGQHQLLRDKEEHANMDVVLLTDMVWHVVIDMIDIFYMMFMANPYNKEDSIVDTAILQKHPETVRRVKAFVGAFIFLALFFHQQSFPSIGFTSASSWPAPPRRSPSKRRTQASTKQPPPLPQQLEYRVDVIKARKRSAIVSLLMVDLPFFVIRTYMYILAMDSEAAAQSTTTPGPTRYSISAPLADWLGRPQLDKWWVKNIICMLLQAMQLRFVQQAELERSQTLRWWDVRRSVSAAALHSARRRRWEQDRNLQRKWHELDRSKMEAALEDTGYAPDSPEQVRPAFEEPMPSLVITEPRNMDSSSPRSASARSPALPHRQPRLLRCCIACWRRLERRNTCCCKCSLTVAAHVLMGAVLGWLIAKVDFNQMVTGLTLGLGRS